ncbi:hypothetical protein [Undibacterium sp. RuTC16W]|uniref:hypothetical protein n=1 Tax=Undibacterium sp. RuTC16W TaxID=3413048 RepID=UPI003BF101AD
MNLLEKKPSMTNFFRLYISLFLIALLFACGGGGGSSGTSTAGGASNSPSLSVSLVDANGVAITSLSGGDIGTLKAKFTSGSGSPIANAVVTFSGDVSLIQLVPISGTALTDANGIAVLNIKPASFTLAGAVAITAQAVSGTLTASTTFNLAVGAAPLTVGTLSFSPAPTAALPAFSTITVNFPVTSNGKAVTSISGLSLTSLCVGDGTASLVQGPSTSVGVFSATYTNKGCTRGTDQITVAIGNSSQSISLAVISANVGSIQFVGTDSPGSAIVLKGTGGTGRKESAVVTFKVVDQTNVGLAGVNVSFSATTTTGGLTVLPASATTDSNGNVSTTVSSGTIPTPVKVIASATRNGNTISGLSDFLTISTGLPIQKSMSLSVDKLNIEGWDYDGEIAKVTVLLADQYGNPVSDNTTINFVAEGGAIGSSGQGACNTTNGGCTVNFRSQAFRPLNGRVTILAYTQGIEDFIDSNGDGQYSCTNFKDTDGNVPSVYRPLVDICISGGEPFTDLGDAFLDTGSLAATSGVSSSGTLDNVYTPANGDLPFPYNHTTYSATGDGKWGINYIRKSAEIIFSGSFAQLIRQVCTSGTCRDWTAADGNASIITGLYSAHITAPATAPVSGVDCFAQSLNFRLTDLNNNPLPADTTITTGDSNKLSTGTYFPDKVLSTNSVGGTFHSVTVKPDGACGSGSITISVKTPKGNGTAFTFNSN